MNNLEYHVWCNNDTHANKALEMNRVEYHLKFNNSMGYCGMQEEQLNSVAKFTINTNLKLKQTVQTTWLILKLLINFRGHFKIHRQCEF